MTELALISTTGQPSPRERQLQQALGCMLLTEPTADTDFYLRLENAGLTLYQNQDKAPGGLRVDFASRDLQRRGAEGLKSQGLGKAIGLKKLSEPTVLDATAGLGNDAFLMAMAGCRVIMLERSAIVAALLADGLQRARNAGDGLAACAGRMELRGEDFLLAEALPAVDVVYLDPMFPHTAKRARSKKGMYLLQELLGPQEESPGLLRKALALAGKRVVVKRARTSPLLGNQQADIAFRGSSNRYDVYLTGNN